MFLLLITDCHPFSVSYRHSTFFMFVLDVIAELFHIIIFIWFNCSILVFFFNFVSLGK